MRWAVLAVVCVYMGAAGCFFGDTTDPEPDDGPWCGDGYQEADEQCDDGAANRSWLPDTCRQDCTLPSCGDEVADSDEGCDTWRSIGQTCESLGYTRGRVTCLPACEPDTSACSLCGDGVAQGADAGAPDYEGCDRFDLRGQTCASLGHGSGNLACTMSCTWALGGCSQPLAACGNGLWEEQEQCDDGNTLDHDGCSADCKRETPRWELLHPPQSPSHRTSYAMAYDVLRDRVVLYGGRSVTGSMDSTPLGNTWEFDGDTWQQVHPAHTPGIREKHAMVYDAHHQRVVLFGGYGDSDERADTWVYDGSDWQQLDTHPAFSPPPSSGHSLAYDASRQRVVLFGLNLVSSNDNRADTWELDGESWQWMEPEVSPPYRLWGALTYDGGLQRIRFFGGRAYADGNDEESRELWDYDGTRWMLSEAGPAPRARLRAAMAYHAAVGAAVLFGGSDLWGPAMEHTWELSGHAWWRVDGAVRPEPRTGHVLVYDVHRRRVLLFGGTSDVEGAYWPTLGDTWVYQYR